MANIIRLGGGGGSQPVLITKSITQNGTYNASSDNADGYSSVNVNVSGGGGSGTPFIFSTKLSNQGITLPVYGDDNYRYEFKLVIPCYQSETLIFGGAWSVSSKLFHTFGSASAPIIVYYISNSYVSISYNYWDIMDIEANTTYIKVDGTTYTGTATTKAHEQVSLYGLSGSHLAIIGISEMKIYDNSDDSLVMDLVPMKDSSTGDGYFHDTVGNTDYTSGVTGGLKYVELTENSN